MPPRHHNRPLALICGINPLVVLIMVITGPKNSHGSRKGGPQDLRRAEQRIGASRPALMASWFQPYKPVIG